MAVNELNWLADARREAGLDVVQLDGWHERGHGELGELWGVICHHSGSLSASPEDIAEGRPDLQGPLSHIHLAQDGTITVVAQGTAWHAGRGQYAGLPTDEANAHTVGIHAVSDGKQPYPDVQYQAFVRYCAAIVRKIGQPASHVIGHKEWNAEKWDPALDMDKFRADVDALLGAASSADAARG
jgi:hypothetical protein